MNSRPGGSRFRWNGGFYERDKTDRSWNCRKRNGASQPFCSRIGGKGAGKRRGDALRHRGACRENGKIYGRSPDDKFIVDTPPYMTISRGARSTCRLHERIRCDRAKMLAYLQNKEIFVFDGFAGADKTYTQRFRIVNEMASQNLFIHQLLIRPTETELDGFVPDFTILAAPASSASRRWTAYTARPAIILDYDAEARVDCRQRLFGRD